MVYVDTPRVISFRGRERLTAHCTADSLDELHAFAERIGAPRRLFEDKPGKPHYDLFDELIERARQTDALFVEKKVFISVLYLRYRKKSEV
jgi:hypothetical protein